MPVDIKFTTKPQLIKRNGRKILGIYPQEKLARKITQVKHVVRVPQPSLTIDAVTYDRELANKLDWCIIFEIDDGRQYWITIPEFNQYKKFLDRGQGAQWRIEINRLHCDGDDAGRFTNTSYTNTPVKSPEKPKTPQLGFNLGGIE